MRLQCACFKLRALDLAAKLDTVEASKLAGATAARGPGPSLWSPFRHRAFSIIWTATVVSNVGSWMYSAAAAWLMTGLNPNPVLVALVQVATTLPMFLFAIPAGAYADIADKRRFLIAGECITTLIATAFAVLVWQHLVTPALLLLFIFLLEAASAVTAPAWQSVVPLLVPREDLPAAVAMNSVGINVSRAVGPALSGVITAASSIAAPFWVNAASNIGVIGALWSWDSPKARPTSLPAEHVRSAIRVGIRHARNNGQLRATLARSATFFFFASCYWALLPLVARSQIGGNATVYGVLLGAIGASAIVGALALPRLRSLGPGRVVAAGSVGTALAMALFGIARGAPVALAASVIAGVSWIFAVATLNVSAQIALPEWVRGRGLAIYVTMMFGALTLGSIVWGQVARSADVPVALFIAAAGTLLTIPLTRHWQLRTGEGADLSPSMDWRPPVVTLDIDRDTGPVMVTVAYRVAPANRAQFLVGLDRLSHERSADGAYAWGIFEDVAAPGRFLETFLVESWLEHLRQHERVTNADRVLQEHINHLVIGEPVVTHLIAPNRD
jgi:predicted MFS family arabinose efflux permease